MPTTPVTTTTPQQSDPYAEFGGSVAAPTPASTSSQASAASSASSDPYAEFGGKSIPEVTSVTPASQSGDVAKHGLLSRAWDWVNTPVFDHVLPTGIKTSDIVKAAAFEKMYGEAYIPGVNDFETKADAHLGENPTKHAIRTFINGAAADTANMVSSFTSPAGLALTLSGVPELEEGGVAAKALSVARPLAGTAFGLQGAHDIYQAGTENTPEAWQQRLQGAAQVVGGAAAVAEPVSAAASRVSPKVRGAASTVENVVKGGQPKLQAAIRDAAQVGAEKSAALGSHPDILDKQVEAPAEDAYPVKLVYDEEGNVADLDGRHRVIQAIDDGKESIPVQVTLRDGTTATIQQDPKVVAEKFGVTKESLATTDQQQAAVRAGGGPREPVLKPAAKAPAAPAETPAEAPAAPTAKTGGIRTAIEDVSNDVKAKSQSLYQRLDNESGGRWQRYEDQIKNLNDKMDEVNGIDDEAYDRLETKRNDIETSQAQMIEDLKEKVSTRR